MDLPGAREQLGWTLPHLPPWRVRPYCASDISPSCRSFLREAGQERREDASQRERAGRSPHQAEAGICGFCIEQGRWGRGETQHRSTGVRSGCFHVRISEIFCYLMCQYAT